MKSAMDERYAKLYADLFKDGLAYAEKAFSERGLPMTDVEDVAAESALKVIAANRRGAFKSAQTDKNREEMQHNRLKCLILDAARRLGYQARQVSLSVLDEKAGRRRGACPSRRNRRGDKRPRQVRGRTRP